MSEECVFDKEVQMMAHAAQMNMVGVARRALPQKGWIMFMKIDILKSVSNILVL